MVLNANYNLNYKEIGHGYIIKIINLVNILLIYMDKHYQIYKKNIIKYVVLSNFLMEI